MGILVDLFLSVPDAASRLFAKSSSPADTARALIAALQQMTALLDVILVFNQFQMCVKLHIPSSLLSCGGNV